MIKCIIVEDETLAQDVIKSHLQQIGHWQLVGVCRNAPEAVAALNTLEVDVMFLDIRLPGMSGLHLLRSLPAPPLVVLTTAYAEYAVESYEFSVIDYLLKPISFERFSRAIGKIEEGKLFSQAGKDLAEKEWTENQLRGKDAVGEKEEGFGKNVNGKKDFDGANNQDSGKDPIGKKAGAERSPDRGTEPDRSYADHIFIRSNSKFFKVDFSEIEYIEGMKDYLKIHTPEYTLVTHQTMNELEKTLPPRQFIRVHKSYIIAISRIRSIYGNSVEIGKATIPIGINYKDEVMNLVGRR